MSHQFLIYILAGIGSLVLVYGLCQLNPVTKKYAGIIALGLTSILIAILVVLNKNKTPAPIPSPVPAPIPVPEPPEPKPVEPQPSVIVITTDYRLSTNFTFGMLVITEHRNYVDKNFEEAKAYLENMRKLCVNVLEPIVQLLGVVPYVTSCFRCLELNTLIGASKNSQHMKAEAGDTTYRGMSLTQVFNKIAWSKIPYSQIIFEFGSWVHVGVIDEFLYPGKIGQKFNAILVDDEENPGKKITKYTSVTKPI